MSSTISAAEFIERLEALCVQGAGRDWPRKPRDQHILMKSTTLMFEPQRNYSEKEVNARLEAWAEQVAPAIWLDHVTVRRFLVDAGYLNRDSAGRRYLVNREQAAELFDADVADLNPVAVVEEAQRRIAERKRHYLDEGKEA